MFSLDVENELPPIQCFAVIIQQLIQGMGDDSKEIKVTVMETIGSMYSYFKETMEPFMPKVLEMVSFYVGC
jgi:hypothetical protein